MPTTTLSVGMTCEGCAGAVKRVLAKVPGVTTVTTDVAAKLVTVEGAAPSGDVLAAVAKWGAAAGKAVSLVGAGGA